MRGAQGLLVLLLCCLVACGCRCALRPRSGEGNPLPDGPARDKSSAGLLEPLRTETHQTSIEAIVLDPSGQPVSGAAVVASTLGYPFYLMHGRDEPQPEPDASARTDACGRARLGPMAPNTYDIIVEAEGYALEVKRSVLLEPGRDELVRVLLRAAPPAYEYLVLLHENDPREAALSGRITALLAARHITVRRTPTNLSQYSLLVRIAHIKEARQLLAQDPELREVLQTSDADKGPTPR